MAASSLSFGAWQQLTPCVLQEELGMGKGKERPVQSQPPSQACTLEPPSKLLLQNRSHFTPISRLEPLEIPSFKHASQQCPPHNSTSVPRLLAEALRSLWLSEVLLNSSVLFPTHKSPKRNVSLEAAWKSFKNGSDIFFCSHFYSIFSFKTIIWSIWQWHLAKQEIWTEITVHR